MAEPDQIDIVADSRPKKTGAAAKVHGFGQFLYNKQEGSVLGRTAGSWGRIGLFYFFFYSGLAGFFAAMLAIFFVTIDRNTPTYTEDSSILRENPGMGFRPMPDYETTLIRFEKGTPSTYMDYVDQIEAFLKPYSSSESTGKQDSQVYTCDKGSGKKADKDGFCNFVTENYFKNTCTRGSQFGYYKGQPCIFLKLNKLFGWEPVTYNSTELPEEVKKNKNVEVDDIEPSVLVTCDGINPADKENIGTVTITPKNGFAAKFFPYLNQHKYRQPLVAVQFQNVTNGVLVMIRCRAWAKNLKNIEFNTKEGAVHFELLID